MEGLRGTELAMPFHPLYTPWRLSPGGTDKKWHNSVKSLSTILTKHLTNLGQMWPKYLPLVTFHITCLTPQIQEIIVHMN